MRQVIKTFTFRDRRISVPLDKRFKMAKKCDWAVGQPLMEAYHDKEWGVPVHDDRLLFEMLCLQGAQAGLSWLTVLKKRENYRRLFDDFDPHLVSEYGKRKINSLLKNRGIIRNRLKVEAAINNAKAFLKILETFDSFDAYIWQFVGGRPRINKFKMLSQIPVSTKESDAMSKDLKARGFKFVGSTICYAYMQASGLVNDHLTKCFRYKQLI